MKLPPERPWPVVTAIFAAAAVLSALMAVLSISNKDTIGTIISGAALILFIACSVLAWNIRSRISEINRPDENVECLRLKRPGIERTYEEEIVPKGKMPDE